jgi:hypothetical protein
MPPPLKYVPITLYQIIQEFLSQFEYWTFMNCAKDFFVDVKKETIYFIIKGKETENLFKNPYLQYVLMEKVKRPTKQLSIEVSHVPHIRSNFQIPQAHHLTISKSKIHSVRVFQGVPKLSLLSECPFLHECDGLMNIQELCISGFGKLIDIRQLSTLRKCEISHCTVLEDVSPLAKVPEVEISSCSNLIEVNVLKNVRKLIFHDCRGITDVSQLGNVDDLSLHNLSNLKDITQLKNNRKISIRHSSRIVDFGSLSRAKHVEIGYCGGYVDPSLFGEAEELLLSGAIQSSSKVRLSPDLRKVVLSFGYASASPAFLQSFQPLQHLHEVRLEHCGVELEMNYFSKVTVLSFEDCLSLTTLDGLSWDPERERRGTYSISVNNCPKCIGFRHPVLIPKLVVKNCRLLEEKENLGSLRMVQQLTLNSMKISSLLPLATVQSSLCLISCNIGSVVGVENIPHLIIEKCVSLTDLHLLNNNETITLKTSIFDPNQYAYDRTYNRKSSSIPQQEMINKDIYDLQDRHQVRSGEETFYFVEKNSSLLLKK